jgi:AAA domain (dynein-related subfamily)
MIEMMFFTLFPPTMSTPTPTYQTQLRAYKQASHATSQPPQPTIIDTAWYESDFRAYLQKLNLPDAESIPLPLTQEKLRDCFTYITKDMEGRDENMEEKIAKYFIDPATIDSTSITENLSEYVGRMKPSYEVLKDKHAGEIGRAMMRQEYGKVGAIKEYMKWLSTYAEEIRGIMGDSGAYDRLTENQKRSIISVWRKMGMSIMKAWTELQKLSPYYTSTAWHPLISHLPEALHFFDEYGENKDYLALHGDDVARHYEQIRLGLNMMHEKVERGEYVKMPSLQRAWDLLERSYAKRVDEQGTIKSSKMVTINGETGGGKTAMAIAFAKEKTGKDPIVIACNPNTGTSELVGTKELIVAYGKDGTAHPKTEMIAQGFQKAAIEGRMVVLDEYTHLNPEVKAIVNKYLDLMEKKGQRVEKDGNGWGRYTVSEKYFVIGTKNIGEQYHGMYEMEKSRENRTESIDLPVMSQRDLTYFMWAKMMGKDGTITWPEELPQILTSMIQMKRTMEENLVKTSHMSDKQLQWWMWKLPVFSNRVMRDIVDYAGHEKYSDLAWWIWKTIIDTWEVQSPQHKIYLYAMASECGLYEDITVEWVLPTTSNVTTIMNTERWVAQVQWEKIQAAMSSRTISERMISHDAVSIVASTYPELVSGYDENWEEVMNSAKKSGSKKRKKGAPFGPGSEGGNVDPENGTPPPPVHLYELDKDRSEHRESQIITYLEHAPAEAADFFKNKLTADEQDAAMEKVTYTEDAIEVLAMIDGKEMIIPYAKANLILPDVWKDGTEKVKTTKKWVKATKKWVEEKYDETYIEFNYFEKEYLEKGVTEAGYTTITLPDTTTSYIPQDTLYESALGSMPAKDYTEDTWCKAAYQLHWLLWGKLLGYRSSGSSHTTDGSGSFWSASRGNTDNARALLSDIT